jgi:phosphate starvation-inducible protein PhoH and related proteins
MTNATHSQTLKLEPADNNEGLALLCGQCDENLTLIENRLHVELHRHGHEITISGKKSAVAAALSALSQLYAQACAGNPVELHEIHMMIRTEKQKTAIAKEPLAKNKDVTLHTKIGAIVGRTENQRAYLKRIFSHDVNFAIGPAGTGKTFLAVACAIDALEKALVERIVLVRPAVEAGESLGFLPGDLSEKVNPYLKPMYDALHSMLGFERTEKLLEKNIIEVAPLAYMRGRTLNDAYIILDEAQNTTPEQMKMFLTRIGFGSRAVITGDITQIDLPHHTQSGLKLVLNILDKIDTISFSYFDSVDVVRHPVVQSIIKAYEHYEQTHDTNTR